MNPVPEFPFEAVPVQQSHEKLEVFFFPVMGRGRHQKKMASQFGKEPAKFSSFCLFDLSSEKRGGHLVRLIANNQVPFRLFQFDLHILVAT